MSRTIDTGAFGRSLFKHQRERLTAFYQIRQIDDVWNQRVRPKSGTNAQPNAGHSKRSSCLVRAAAKCVQNEQENIKIALKLH